jgi:hypothetical protein
VRALVPLFLALALPAHAADALEALCATAYASRERARFVPPTASERARFRDAFADLVRAASARGASVPLALRARFADLGFSVGEVALAGGPGWTLAEPIERARGGGVYAVRVGPDAGPWAPERAGGPGVTRCVLMAPHPNSDRGTGLLAQRLFARTRARAFLQASVHRAVADPAHREDTFFQAATEALDAVAPDQMFLQLHGFEATRHAGLAAGVGAIVSDGRRPAAGPVVARVAELWRRRHAGAFVAVYGAEARRLGGTTNSQARLLNASGRSLFVHLEMAAEVRELAVRDAVGLPAESFARTLALAAGL